MAASVSPSFVPLIHKTMEFARTPMFADVLRPRSLALFMAGVGAAQVGCSMCFHLGIPCAFHASTGLPCPGCGLTRSVMALLHGQVRESVNFHPFGWMLLAGMIFALGVGILPETVRRPLINGVERVEIRTGLTFLLMVAFMLLWVLRVTGAVHLAPI